MTNSFKTQKGTTLPLMDLKGKAYLGVAYRIVWFREEHPDWSIETNLHQMTADYVIFKARITDETGKIMSTAHKMAFNTSSKNPLEMAETGSIGRALALIGYGTAFTDDFEEEETEPADAPLPLRTKPQIASTSIHGRITR